MTNVLAGVEGSSEENLCHTFKCCTNMLQEVCKSLVTVGVKV